MIGMTNEEDTRQKIEDAFDHAFSEAMATGHSYQVAAKRALKAAKAEAKKLGVPCQISEIEAYDMGRLAELCDITDDECFGESDFDGWDW